MWVDPNKEWTCSDTDELILQVREVFRTEYTTITSAIDTVVESHIDLLQYEVHDLIHV